VAEAADEKGGRGRKKGSCLSRTPGQGDGEQNDGLLKGRPDRGGPARLKAGGPGKDHLVLGSSGKNHRLVSGQLAQGELDSTSTRIVVNPVVLGQRPG